MKETHIVADGLTIPITVRSWEEAHGITLCIMALNEENNIAACIDHHAPYVSKVLVLDGGSTDDTFKIASKMADSIAIFKFDGHYSNQYNRMAIATKTDWMLVIDADERLESHVLSNLGKLTDQEVYDCYAFPRMNYVDGMYDAEHYPDYQDRLHRTYCRRIRPVHHELVGYKNKLKLPAVEGNHIIHTKFMARHLSRNSLYKVFELKGRHEMGGPGSQASEESFNKTYPTLGLENFKIT